MQETKQMLVTASANAELDHVLELLCEALQPTKTLWEDAEQKYTAVGNWLSAPNSKLKTLKPDIKYQGSALLETVVRPWAQEEFDIDLLCILSTDRIRHPDPLKVYEMVADRLDENGLYQPRMTRKERCIELNYSGQFHLDVVPAIPVSSFSRVLLIPDRKRKSWICTDPFGYADWFKKRTPVAKFAVDRYEARAEVAPLRPAKRAAEISPLQRTVQLMKRRRDLFFAGSDNAPKSIALTTLTAEHYQGEPLCTDSLQTVLKGIQDQIRSTRGILTIPNPVQQNENLSRHWNVRSYALFKLFVDQFLNELTSLSKLTGWDRITEALDLMFGDRAKVAVENYGRNLDLQRRGNQLPVSRGPLILTPSVIPTTGRVVRNNEFFGN
jgi:hypothetical protein